MSRQFLQGRDPLHISSHSSPSLPSTSTSSSAFSLTLSLLSTSTSTCITYILPLASCLARGVPTRAVNSDVRWLGLPCSLSCPLLEDSVIRNVHESEVADASPTRTELWEDP